MWELTRRRLVVFAVKAVCVGRFDGPWTSIFLQKLL